MPDNYSIEVMVESFTNAREEVLTSQLATMISGLELGANQAAATTASRMVPSQVLVTAAASCLVTLAWALREFVKKQRVCISITTVKGETLRLDASGLELNDVADLVGFITGSHTKITKQKNKKKTFKPTSKGDDSSLASELNNQVVDEDD